MFGFWISWFRRWSRCNRGATTVKQKMNGGAEKAEKSRLPKLEFWRHHQKQNQAAGQDANGGAEKSRLPKLKFWRHHQKQNRAAGEEELHPEEQPEASSSGQQHPEELPEASSRGQHHLEASSSGLVLREEQLFSQDNPSEDEENRLQQDLETLRLEILLVINDTFSSSPGLVALRSAVVAIRQQEMQDQRWTLCRGQRVPRWRPQKFLRAHNDLVTKMVESRMEQASEEELSCSESLSTPLKRKVCRMGKRLKDDLLAAERTVKDCYPPEMDILNVYAGLLHCAFASRLTKLVEGQLEPDDRSYLLFWVNHCYPQDILEHPELQGKIKTACLGSLLLREDLTRLEDQYLNHRQDTVRAWLCNALSKEVESWQSLKEPELIHQYRFSPLAADVIQLLDSFHTELSRVVREPQTAERTTGLLKSFLSSYRQALEDFVGGNHGNTRSVFKAQLACEEQLRDYITKQQGSLFEHHKGGCLDSLDALRHAGYQCFNGPTHTQMKVCSRQLWTPSWLDGSLPVVDSLLDQLFNQLTDLSDLKPSCREAVMSLVHQDLVLEYMRRTMKSKLRGKEQEVGGAQRMIDDSQKISAFFTERGSTSSWVDMVLPGVAELLRLQDPESIQLEMVTLARKFPDISDVQVSRLLSLKTGLTAADVRFIRQNVQEDRAFHGSSNHSPEFFSRVKVKWINKKLNQMKR